MLISMSDEVGEEERKDVDEDVAQAADEVIEDVTQPIIEETKKDSEEVLAFIKKHQKTILLIALLIIPIFLSVFIRIQPAYLPVTEDWAENAVIDSVRRSIDRDSRQQFPTLPDAQREQFVEEQVAIFVEENQANIKQEVQNVANNFKQRLQDDSGQTYLLAIDPYYYSTYARNLIETGELGNSEVGGAPYDTKALAPQGRDVPRNWHVFVDAWMFRISKLFGNDNLLTAFFLAPLIIATLAVIPCFFILRKISGKFAAVVGSSIVAVHTAFMTRTVAGFSDTDAYNVLFPVLIAWALLGSIESKNEKWKYGFGILAGVATGIYSRFWTGWWYIFDIALAAIGLYFLYELYLWKQKKGHKKEMMDTLKNGITYFVSSLIFLGLVARDGFMSGATSSFHALFQFPFGITQLKDVATKTIWPNVFTTVAELNPSSISSTIGVMGGVFLFGIAIAGIAVLLMQKKKQHLFFALFLAIWTIVAVYASTRGIRFTLILVPAFGMAIGCFFGLATDYLAKQGLEAWKMKKSITYGIMIVVAVLLLANPVNPSYNMVEQGYNQAIHEIPSMNDAWWNALTNIKENSQEDAIITSWWDFGHWFRFVADRAATFDGASQNRPQAHWVGRMLQTADEKESLALLRMIDCGADDSNRILFNHTQDELTTVRHIQALLKLSREDAISYLADNSLPAELIEKTHCTPPEAFVIASEDMIGKASVWGHFGSWNFERASMVVQVRKEPRESSIQLLQDQFGLSAETAAEHYTEIQNTDPNQWISPWPGYFSGFRGCNVLEEGDVFCDLRFSGQQVPIIFNTTTQDIEIPGGERVQSLVFFGDQMWEKAYKDAAVPVSVVIRKEGESYSALVAHPLLGSSIFTRMFFLEGKGLECYNLFDKQTQVTGQKIYVYTVDWECASQT